MSEDREPESSLILYQTEDGRTRIQCRFEADTIWPTNRLAELFQTKWQLVRSTYIFAPKETGRSPAISATTGWTLFSPPDATG